MRRSSPSIAALFLILFFPLVSTHAEVHPLPYCRTSAAPLLVEDAMRILSENGSAVGLATRIRLAAELFRTDGVRARSLFEAIYREIHSGVDTQNRSAMLEQLAHRLPIACHPLKLTIIDEILSLTPPGQEPRDERVLSGPGVTRTWTSQWRVPRGGLRRILLEYARAVLAKDRPARQSILAKLDDWLVRYPRLRDYDIKVDSVRVLRSYLHHLDPWLEYQYDHDRSGDSSPSLLDSSDLARLSESPLRDSRYLHGRMTASTDYTGQLDLAVALYQLGDTELAFPVLRQYESGRLRNSLVRARFLEFCVLLAHCRPQDCVDLLQGMSGAGRQEALGAIMPVLCRTSPRVAGDILLPAVEDAEGEFALMVVAGLTEAGEISQAENRLRAMPVTAQRAFAEKLLGEARGDAERVRRADAAVEASLHEAWGADRHETYGPRMGRFLHLRALIALLFRHYEPARAQALLMEAVPPLDPRDTEAAGMLPILLDLADRDPDWVLGVFRKDAPVRFKRNESITRHCVSVLLPKLAPADSAFVRDYINRYGEQEHPQTRAVMERELASNLSRTPLQRDEESLLAGQGGLENLTAILVGKASRRDEFLSTCAVTFYRQYRVSEAMTLLGLIESPDARIDALVTMAAESRVEDRRERGSLLAAR